MYRALPLYRQVAPNAERSLVRVTRRRLATEVPPTIKKKKSIFRRILFYTSAAVGTFYVGSAFVAFNNHKYYDIFTERVPLGISFIDFAESHNWDTLTARDVFNSGKNAARYVQRLVTGQTSNDQAASDQAKATASASREQIRETKAAAAGRVQSVARTLRTTVEKGREEIVQGGAKAAAIARHQSNEFAEGVEDLIRKAEAAIAGKPIPHTTSTHAQSDGIASDANLSQTTHSEMAAPDSVTVTAQKIYDVPLPVDHQPPLGFSRPQLPKPSHPPVEAHILQPLPLVAPAISELGASEPIIAHLASTIDNLASYLNSNPSAAAKAKDVLETAKTDLTNLATRIEKVKDDERVQLEAKLDEQTREYTLKLLELEMEAQDKLDSQEDGFRKFFDQERTKFVQAYREKLDHELKTQTELINERLKEEVIAQGIEMQRRWIREIKVRVEQERGGRLAKLDELAANLKRLERVAMDNSTYLDENIRIHALWSALRALNNAVESSARTPFRKELRVLRHIAAAREDPVVTTALEALETSDVPDIGVEPFADLASWFSTSVAPRVSSVALVPDQNAGVISHLASHLFSTFRFRRHGPVQGSDVLSVLARAEYYMNEKDLDSAARELNQLRGTAKVLLADWLEAARRRLEVQQALQVVQSQATLASLLVI